jgi:hypothetical protein
MDGVIGVFSGSALPPNVTTETGLLRLSFTSDSTIQRTGWAAAYTAAASIQSGLPECAGGTVPVQAALRTRLAASELAWVVARRGADGATLGSARGAAPVMAGGLLPAAVQLAVPAAVERAADGEYRDFRSYYSYACLLPGAFELDLYDSYGDGWGGARMMLSALVMEGSGPDRRVAAACQLASGTVDNSVANIAFTLEVRRP